MKFLTTATALALGFSTVVSAAPHVDRRDLIVYSHDLAKRDTVVGTIGSILTNLTASVTASEAAIFQVLSSVTGSVTATVSVVAVVNANLHIIAGAVENATVALTTIITATVQNITTGVLQLTQQEINLLIADIHQIQAIVGGIGATLIITVTNINPAITAAVHDEVVALQNLLTPFLSPVQVLVTAIAGIQATIQLTITGLGNAISGVLSIITGILLTLG